MRWMSLLVAMVLLSGCASDPAVLPDPQSTDQPPAETDDTGSDQGGDETGEGGDEPAPQDDNGTAAGEDGNETEPTGNETEPPANATLTPVFVDGAEDGAAQWTFATQVYEASFTGEFRDVPAEAMEAYPFKWAASADEHFAGANAWYPTYPDEHRMHMTSVAIALEGAGPHALTFWVKGGSEDNSGGAKDGLHVSAGPAGGSLAEVSYTTGVFAEWTQVTVPLALSGDIQVQFSFWSDLGCSGTNYPDQEIPQVGPLCGPGSGDGLYVDDIAVA